VDQLWRRTDGPGPRKTRACFLKENKDIRDKLENVLRKEDGNPGAGPNECGSARTKMAMLLRHKGTKRRLKASAAIAGVDASKARPTR